MMTTEQQQQMTGYDNVTTINKQTRNQQCNNNK